MAIEMEKAKNYKPNFLNVVEMRPIKTAEQILQERQADHIKEIQDLEIQIKEQELGRLKLERLLVERGIKDDPDD